MTASKKKNKKKQERTTSEQLFSLDMLTLFNQYSSDINTEGYVKQTSIVSFQYHFALIPRIQNQYTGEIMTTLLHHFRLTFHGPRLPFY